jgi:TPP-dependent pyruvate/acetoin dehydrogenase alpha subunit
VLFLCENNGYAIHTHQRLRQHAPEACARARALGIEAERIEDGDVLRIAERARAAAHVLRAGGPPRFLECLTYRMKEHVGPGEDWHLGYRSREEAEPWVRRDPVPRLAALLPPDVAERIRAEVDAEVADAFLFAEKSPVPEPAELHTDVYRSPR